MFQNDELVNWIKQSVDTDNCEVEIEGIVEKGTGYVADIFFAKVKLNEPNSNGKELYLVAKVSKDTKDAPNMRKLSEEICKREVKFYNEIVPLFKRFQEEKNIKQSFEGVPKCYKTFITENTEVLIQENMKVKGYELHAKSVPMNINHIKLAFKNYAKFHAISFALQDQKPDVFKKINENFFNVMIDKFPMFEGMYEKSKSKIIENLNEVGREDLAVRYKKSVEKGVSNILVEVFKDVPAASVVTHSDCHNGNMLFQYKNSNKEDPSNMVFLDFQLACVHSPIIDLSLFIYCGTSKHELSHFIELMEFYHNELSSFLSQLGSDVNKIFPISTLWQHWKKYSVHGFNTASMFLELLFVDPSNAPELSESKNEDFKEFLDIKLNSKTEYLERLVDIVEHYLNFNNIH